MGRRRKVACCCGWSGCPRDPRGGGSRCGSGPGLGGPLARRLAAHRPARTGARPARSPSTRPTSPPSAWTGRRSLLRPGRHRPRARARPSSSRSPSRMGASLASTSRAAPRCRPSWRPEHPDIRDYVGTGVDDPSASLSLVISPEGAYAAIRGSDGTSYVEPRYRDDATTHVAFAREDLPNPAPFHEDEATAQQLETSLPPSALRPGPGEDVPLRTYRLALINDQTYANFFGGSDAQVLAAKTALMARVNQIYRQDLGITMTLIPQTDALNLNTDAKAINPGGPCGGPACYTSGQLTRCADSTLTQTTIVLGQIVGAHNYDIGHLALAAPNGGGLAAAGVGDALKAEGCTGSGDSDGRRLGGRLRRPRDGAPVRRLPHVERDERWMYRRKPGRCQCGGARVGVDDHGVRGTLRQRRPPAAIGPVLLPAVADPDLRMGRRTGRRPRNPAAFVGAARVAGGLQRHRQLRHLLQRRRSPDDHQRHELHARRDQGRDRRGDRRRRHRHGDELARRRRRRAGSERLHGDLRLRRGRAAARPCQLHWRERAASCATRLSAARGRTAAR